MPQDTTALLLALSALVRSHTETRKQRERCRIDLLAALEDLEAQEKAQVHPDTAVKAQRAIKLACWSCGRCCGV